MSEAEVSTNQAKYESGNPVVQRLLDRFFVRLRGVVAPLSPDSLLDAGCGEGEALVRLGDLLPGTVAAVDLEQQCVDDVRARLPEVDVSRQSVLDLEFGDRRFDLVICLEVLEHLDDPGAAVAELARVAGSHVVVSVPFEPWFRLGNLVRGQHRSGWGNHPEHVNHFRPRSLKALLGRDLDDVEVTVAFPWLIARGSVRAG